MQKRSLTGCLFIVGIFMGTALAQPALDYGDHASSTLTTKAWEALERNDSEQALAFTGKCIELYSTEARTMQATLSGFPSTDPPQTTFKLWALNDVGTCWFIRGEALVRQKMNADAVKAYETVVRDYAFTQCWDPRGWFWKPAEVARQKVLELQFDAE